MKTSPKSRPDEFGGSYFIYIQSKKPFEHQSMGFFNIFFPLSSASIYLSIRFVRSGLFTRCQLSETVRCIHRRAHNSNTSVHISCTPREHYYLGNVQQLCTVP